MGGEESAGLTMRGHVPEKDGILACLLVAEMTAARGASIGEQIRAMYKKLGRRVSSGAGESAPDGRTESKRGEEGGGGRFDTARKKSSIGWTGQMEQNSYSEDGSWMLLRLSGTEPLMRLYVEAESTAATAKLVRDASGLDS